MFKNRFGKNKKLYFILMFDIKGYKCYDYLSEKINKIVHQCFFKIKYCVE